MPTIGQQIFSLLAATQLALIIFIAPSLTAGAIAGERERQTFELLLTSKLASWAIILGKLLASLSYVLLLVVASLPVFSLAFLFGGISVRQFWLTAALSVLTALMIGCISLFLSTVVRRVQIATALSYAVALILTLGIGLASSLLVQPNPKGPPETPVIAYLNPLAALAAILTSTNSGGYYSGGVSIPLPTGYQPYYGTITPAMAAQMPFWAMHMIISGVIIVVTLALSILFLRPRRWLPRRATTLRRSTPVGASRADSV